MDVKKIGNKIRERRTALNMTQKDLALKMNISNQLISKWETGESLPSLEYLDSLCNALEVDFTFFTKDDEQPPATPSTPAESQTAPPTDEKPQTRKQTKPKRKVNVLLIVILCTCVLAAMFIAGITLLTYFAIVPAANKQSYIREMDNSLNNYFSHGYYNIVKKLQIDGDDEDDVIYKGVIDDNGNIAFYKDGITYADGVITDNVNETVKYRTEIPEHVKTLEDLVKWQIFDDEEEDDFDLDYIRYVRRTGKGFYMEMSEEYLTEDMDGSVKKNIKFLDKIRGEAQIKNGVIVSLSVTVKYRNIADNENFTIVSGFEFKDEKPVIAHSNLEGRQWGDGYYDYAPKCDNLATEADFMAKLGAKKAESQIGEAIINNKIGYAEGYIYCWQDNKIILYNPADLSVKKTYAFNNTVENVYIYGNKLYYSEKTDNTNIYLNAINLADGSNRQLFEFNDYDGVKYNGKYCWYSAGDYSRVTNLDGQPQLYFEIIGFLWSVEYVDNAGNVYTKEYLNEERKLKVYLGGKGEGVVLKGSFYSWDWGNDEKYYGDTVYTVDYPKAYRYEKGVYKDTVEDYYTDLYINGTYISACDGYCFRYGYSCPLKLFNKDGSVKDAFTPIKTFADSDGSYHTCTTQEALGAAENKIIVEMNASSAGNYAAVYDATNLAKPLCYMKLIDVDYNSTSIKIFNAGDKAVIAVKQADGSYSVWIA